MRALDPRLKIIYPYLKRRARILELGTYYWEKAIEEKDLNGDGNKEIIVLYESEEINYLLILRQGRRSWLVAYHERLPFREIIYFKLEGIVDRITKQIMIGGRKHQHTKEYHLEIFQYSDNKLTSILGEEDIQFDKIETQVVGTKTQIIVWKHLRLEAYDVNVYRYENGVIQQGGWDEVIYFKTVVGYYKYLIENYPDEPLYVEYLEKAQAKIGEYPQNNTQQLREEEIYEKMLELQNMYKTPINTREENLEESEQSLDNLRDKDKDQDQYKDQDVGQVKEKINPRSTEKSVLQREDKARTTKIDKICCKHSKYCKRYCQPKKKIEE